MNKSSALRCGAFFDRNVQSAFQVRDFNLKKCRIALVLGILEIKISFLCVVVLEAALEEMGFFLIGEF